MSKYVEQNLGKGEIIVKKADRNGLFLLSTWIRGILLCWFLLIPFIQAIIKTVQFKNVELAVTNKRVVGKTGVVNTKAMDSALNKIQNVSVTQKFGGKIFNYATVKINTAAGEYEFGAIKHANEFKSILMAQIDQFEEDRLNLQAQKMATAMASAIQH